MSKLEFYARPLVAFDPDKKEHRRYYHDFVKFKGWGSCPVRFICPESHGMNLVTMIQQSMLDYYIKKEFVARKQQTKTVVQKTKKTVDKQPKR
jgi:hypothetical protein